MWTKEKLLKSAEHKVKVCGDEMILRKLKAVEVIGSDDVDASFRLVSSSLINPVLSIEDVKNLDAELFNALIAEVNKVNGIGRESETKKD